MYRYLKLGDPVVICPYNKNHLIARSRLQKHIVKCEKNYPENYKVMCPYDATHRLHKSEVEEHILTYHNRNVLEPEILNSEATNHGWINFPLPSEVSSTVDCTENWDLDMDSSIVELDDECTSNDNFVLQKMDLNISEREDLRPPHGYSEAMLRESNEDSAVEDLESVYSSSGIGRGKLIQEIQMKLVGRGGRRPFKRD